MTDKLISRAVVEQARDWIATRPEDRPISAGRMVALLTQALGSIPEVDESVPAGWRLVPLEPTMDMSIAFGESFYSKPRFREDDDISDIWSAMLAVAPQPSEPVTSCHQSGGVKGRGGLTAREVELLDGLIERELNHAARCDSIGNRKMAEKQKEWDMERVTLLRKLKSSHMVGDRE